MTDRYERLQEAYPQTFVWIWEAPNDQQRPWNCFKDWLVGPKSMYWISGKAGSGKSTLMRYIYDHGNTMQYLRSWRKGESEQIPTYVAAHFFWNSGTLEQQSQQGLLKTLLYQLLSQVPQLIVKVLPWLWASLYSQSINGLPMIPEKPMMLIHLKEAFRILVHQTDIPLKICLFVDGLDEFNGDHEEIVEYFQSFSTLNNIKICLSSRPWQVFEDSFGAGPSLRLQDLTYCDIKHMVHDRLHKNAAFRNLVIKEPLQAGALIEEIIQSADGVFLWVVLVVRSLLEGFRNRDRIDDLQRRLRLLPKELKPLYSHLLSKIDWIYLEWASKAFQVVRTARLHRTRFGPKQVDAKPLTAIQLYLALDDELKMGALLNIARILADEERDTEVHVTTRCAGLLEIWKRDPRQTGEVHYLHRTARYFLEAPDIWQDIIGWAADTDFNPNDAMLKCCVRQLAIYIRWPGLWSLDKEYTTMSALIYASQAEAQMPNPRSILLDHLDVISARHARQWRGNYLVFPSTREPLLWFLPAAVRYNLTSYVHVKLMSHFDPPIQEEKSLLHHLLRSDEEQRYPVPDVKMVALLLETGLDPNELFDGESPWQLALRRIQKVKWGSQDDRAEPLEMLRIIKMLLEYGANCSAGVGGRTPLSIITVVSEYLPQEGGEVLRKIESRMA